MGIRIHHINVLTHFCRVFRLYTPSKQGMCFFKEYKLGTFAKNGISMLSLVPLLTTQIQTWLCIYAIHSANCLAL